MNGRGATVLFALLFAGGAVASYDDWYFDSFYDDYYWDYFDFLFDEECVINDDGNYVVNGTRPCDVRVMGGYEADKLDGGLAGLYVYTGCQNGKAMYERIQSDFGGKPVGERFIIFSSYWGDWDFSDAEILTDESTVGYGGEGDSESYPQYVPRSDWYVLTDLTSEEIEQDFLYAPSLTVECNANCTDSIQNGYEMGVDCGGDCAPCEMTTDFYEQQAALDILRTKVQAETSTELTSFEKVMIVLVCFIGTGIVCGGPTMYYLKKHLAEAPRTRPAHLRTGRY